MLSFLKKHSFVALISLLFYGIKSNCQNLVPNFSFEQFDTCPNALGQLKYAYPWFRPTSGTSDYYNSCFDTSVSWFANVDVPDNFCGFQNARTGDGYSGLIVFIYNPNSREYIESRLDSQLIAGVTYYVKFYVSRADSCIWAVDAIGAYFSIDSVLNTNWSPLPYMPQVENPVGNIITDRVNWTLISGSFIAQGGEKYITIGNFKDDQSTDTLSVPGGNPTPQGYRFSYYYIDDICVSSDSTICNSLSGYSSTNTMRKFEIYPNPSKGELFLKNLPLKKFNIKIYNNIGAIVLEKNIYDNNSELEIDLNSLNDGLYFIRSDFFNCKILLIK